MMNSLKNKTKQNKKCTETHGHPDECAEQVTGSAGLNLGKNWR